MVSRPCRRGWPEFTAWGSLDAVHTTQTMKRSNSVLIWVIVGVLTLGCCGVIGTAGLGVFLGMRAGNTAMQDGLREGDEMLRNIAQPWSAQAIVDRADPYARGMSLKEVQPKVARMEEEFGALSSFSGTTAAWRIQSTTSQGTYTEVAYRATAVFQKKPGLVAITLRKRENRWYIYSFLVSDGQ